MKFTNLIQLLLVMILLSGCNSDFKIDVFSSDIFRSENVTTPAEMAVEISSCNSSTLERDKTQILSMFAPTSNAKIIGCERRGMESMLLVSIDAEIASKESNVDLILFRENVSDVTHEGKNYEFRAIRPMLSSQFIQRVRSVVENNLGTLTYDKISFAVTLNNDLQEDMLFSGNNLWVNGEPKEQYRRQPLSRRKKLDLKFADIISDLILKSAAPRIFYVGQQK